MRSHPPERGAGIEPLPAALLEQFSAFVAERVGLHFPRARLPDLEQALLRAAREEGAADARSHVLGLLAQPLSRPHVERLASLLTIGETYFFRDPVSFKCLEEQVIPRLLRERAAEDRRLRIWSAGCSTGEEPYSLAMVLARTVAPASGWHVSILATDITPRALMKATAGVYGAWSFRSNADAMQRRFFRDAGDGRFEVAPSIRAMVDFAHLNLAEDTFPSLATRTNAMDIIFCRNVLMYFEPSRALGVLRSLERSLRPGGWLFVSPVEIPHALPETLERLYFDGAIVLRKKDPAARVATPAPPADRPAPECRQSRVTATDHRTPRARRHLPRGEAPLEALYARAGRHYAAGDNERALGALREILAQHPGHAKAMALMARMHANDGRLEEALAWCERAIATDKLDPAWAYLRATILLEEDRIAEARTALRRAIFLDGGYALAHFMLANLSRHEGANEEAARHFRNALSILRECPRDRVLEESEGMTAGRLAEIIEASLASEGSP